MILNNSPAIYVDGKMAERVYRDGELVWGLPKEYQRVEYLESTGEQWIDTLFLADSECVFFVDFSVLDDTASFGIAGARINATEHNLGVLFNNEAIIIDFADYNVNRYRNFLTKSRYAYRWDKDGVWLDGNKVYSFKETPYFGLSSITYLLFKCNGQPMSYGGSYLKIFRFNVKKNGAYVLNLLPCYRKSDFRPGMYDTVTKRFFVNRGTGADFIVGQNI